MKNNQASKVESKLASIFAEVVKNLRQNTLRQDFVDKITSQKGTMPYKGFALVQERLKNEIRIYLTYNELVPKLKSLISQREDDSFLSFSVFVGNSNLEEQSFEIRVGVFGLECDIAAKAVISHDGLC